MVLFAAAALTHLMVWSQLLQLAIGSGPIALGISLGVLTGGMSLGAAMLPRVVSPRHHPLKVFAILEFGIAFSAILVLFGVPYVDGFHGILLRAILSGVILLTPSVLMGATFEAITRWIEASPRGISPLGFFYASAFAGGAFGCLLAGFYLLRLHDVAVATGAAATVNLGTAAIAFLLSRKTPHVQPYAMPNPAVPSVPGVQAVHMSVALSGCAALGTHVVWMRLLPLVLGTSVYTFPLVLFVFLLGLGIGSGAGSALARRSAHPRRDLAICLMLAAACVAWSAYMLTEALPYWPIDPRLTRSAWFGFQLDLFRSAWVVLPAACFWGASLPLALAAGRRSGIYPANMLGASIGAAAFSMLLIPWFGTGIAQQALIGLSVAAALLALASFSRRVTILCAVLAGTALLFTVAPAPLGVIAYGRSLAWKLSNTDSATQDYFVPRILAASEGMHASIAVSETSTGIRNFHINGTIEAATARQDMRLQRMLGDLPGLLHARPRSVLIAGLGAALTAGSLANHPTVERIVICEIEPRTFGMVSFFARQNSNVIEDPRVEIVYDDARHYLLTTEEKFDVITSEPIHPWAQGAAGLFTREYFEVVRRHLNPGGIVSQSVPLHQNSVESVKNALATFFDVFPGGSLWSNDVGGKGYELVVLGGDSAIAINAGEIQEKLNRRNHVNVMRALQEAGFGSAIELLATQDGRASDLAPWLAGIEINRDRNLRLQYLAGLSMNLSTEASIYDSMLQYRRPAEEIFAGSRDVLEELKRAVDRRRPRTLSEAQAAAISSALAARPARRMSASVVIGDQEALQYATALRQSIGAGGWQVGRIRQSEFSDSVAGLLIFVGTNPPPAEANELFQALRAAGLTVEGNFDPKANPNNVLLVVGTHP